MAERNAALPVDRFLRTGYSPLDQLAGKLLEDTRHLPLHAMNRHSPMLRWPVFAFLFTLFTFYGAAAAAHPAGSNSSDMTVSLEEGANPAGQRLLLTQFQDCCLRKALPAADTNPAFLSEKLCSLTPETGREAVIPTLAAGKPATIEIFLLPQQRLPFTARDSPPLSRV